MSFTDAIKTCFRKYVTFSGRATRSEFWKFILFILLGLLVCIVVNSVINGPSITYKYAADASGQPVGQPLGTKYSYSSGIFGNVFGLIILLPWLSVGWRRMHDIGKPGYLPFATILGWIALIFIMIVASVGLGDFIEAIQTSGSIKVQSTGLAIVGLLTYIAVFAINIRWLTRPSQTQANKYGPNPQEVSS